MISQTTARQLAKNLTVAHRTLLIRHIDQRLPLDRRSENHARRTLITKEFIKFTQVSGAASTKFPTHTILTDLGRIVVCAVLTEYAEAIISAADFLERMGSPPTAPLALPKIAKTAEETLAGGWRASRVP